MMTIIHFVLQLRRLTIQTNPTRDAIVWELPPESEEGTSKILTEETIFEHIRKKAKNFPAVNTVKSLKSESFIMTKELYARNQLESKNAAFDMLKLTFSNQDLVDLDTEPPMELKNEALMKAGSQVKHSLLSQSSRGTVGSSDQKAANFPTLAHQMVSNGFSFKGRGSSTESSRKQLESPSRSRRQRSSAATTSQNKEVDSFLGFKSVFSFL